MAHLLHIDSSVQGDQSVSRRLTAHAADRWRAAHPGGTVTYRDLASNPIPHLDAETGMARMLPADALTAAQQASLRSAPSWSTRSSAPTRCCSACRCTTSGRRAPSRRGSTTSSRQACRSTPKPVQACWATPTSSCSTSRGGGYGAGTPREGWDHARGLAAARGVADGADAADHHRRTDHGRRQSRDGRAQAAAGRRQPEPGARGDRRAVGRRERCLCAAAAAVAPR